MGLFENIFWQKLQTRSSLLLTKKVRILTIEKSHKSQTILKINHMLVLKQQPEQEAAAILRLSRTGTGLVMSSRMRQTLRYGTGWIGPKPWCLPRSCADCRSDDPAIDKIPHPGFAHLGELREAPRRSWLHPLRHRRPLGIDPIWCARPDTRLIPVSSKVNSFKVFHTYFLLKIL